MEEDNFVDIDFYIAQLWYGETGRNGEQGEMETEHSTLSVSLSRPFPVSPPTLLPFDNFAHAIHYSPFSDDGSLSLCVDIKIRRSN